MYAHKQCKEREKGDRIKALSVCVIVVVMCFLVSPCLPCSSSFLFLLTQCCPTFFLSRKPPCSHTHRRSPAVLWCCGTAALLSCFTEFGFVFVFPFNLSNNGPSRLPLPPPVPTPRAHALLCSLLSRNSFLFPYLWAISLSSKGRERSCFITANTNAQLLSPRLLMDPRV